MERPRTTAVTSVNGEPTSNLDITLSNVPLKKIPILKGDETDEPQDCGFTYYVVEPGYKRRSLTRKENQPFDEKFYDPEILETCRGFKPQGIDLYGNLEYLVEFARNINNPWLDQNKLEISFLVETRRHKITNHSSPEYEEGTHEETESYSETPDMSMALIKKKATGKEIRTAINPKKYHRPVGETSTLSLDNLFEVYSGGELVYPLKSITVSPSRWWAEQSIDANPTIGYLALEIGKGLTAFQVLEKQPEEVRIREFLQEMVLKLFESVRQILVPEQGYRIHKPEHEHAAELTHAYVGRL
ncbi:MAG: hypothetical protein GY861_23430 [bacterium]|nr:hypothetical protein [bacterium]